MRSPANARAHRSTSPAECRERPGDRVRLQPGLDWSHAACPSCGTQRPYTVVAKVDVNERTGEVTFTDRLRCDNCQHIAQLDDFGVQQPKDGGS